MIAVYLRGSLKKGVGPQDVAIALCGAVFKNGFVKNKILEFVGPGIRNLSMDYRNGIDVMTTETACLSSVWETDEKTQRILQDPRPRAAITASSSPPIPPITTAASPSTSAPSSR